MELLAYSSWASFKADFIPELYPDGHFRPGELVFRGLGSDDWTLNTAFDRQFSQLEPDRRVALWSQLVDAFTQLHQRSQADPTSGPHGTALLALGQHYGLPTRLLDWSESPYIAAFFAFRKALSELHPATGRVAIWALRPDPSVFSKDFGVEFYTEPASPPNERMRRQSGSFTLMRTPHASLEDWLKEMRPKDTVLWKATIP
jgi:hypothetical protein